MAVLSPTLPSYLRMAELHVAAALYPELTFSPEARRGPTRLMIDATTEGDVVSRKSTLLPCLIGVAHPTLARRTITPLTGDAPSPGGPGAGVQPPRTSAQVVAVCFPFVCSPEGDGPILVLSNPIVPLPQTSRGNQRRTGAAQGTSRARVSCELWSSSCCNQI